MTSSKKNPPNSNFSITELQENSFKHKSREDDSNLGAKEFELIQEIWFKKFVQEIYHQIGPNSFLNQRLDDDFHGLFYAISFKVAIVGKKKRKRKRITSQTD